MRVKTILGFLVGAVMVVGFLTQIWEVFDQFHSGLKTIAVSYEERDTVEFPSFAVCDSRAFRKLTPWTADAEHYNGSTFDLEIQVSLYMPGQVKQHEVNMAKSYSTELLPTVYNGYCLLYEFQRKFPINAVACKYYGTYIICLRYKKSSHFSVFDAWKYII